MRSADDSEFIKFPGGQGGPLGLGDPDDKSLRKVEIEVCIPKIMRQIANDEKCTEEVKKCCKENGFGMVIWCRKQNSALKSCLEKWFFDEDFKKRCTELYLDRRTEYRTTGLHQSSTKLKGVLA